ICKLLEDVRNVREELAEYINSLSWNCPIFFYDEDEEYTIQYREYLEKFSNAIAPILPTEEPEYSLSMGYEHLNTTPKTESDKIIKSGVEELVPIPSECEVTSEDKSECDVLVCEDSSTFDVCEDHYEILSDSNDDDISSDDNAFEDIDYVEASPLDSELVSLEEENDDKSECDVLVCEDSSTFDVCEDHYEILSDSNDDDILSDDNAFEDIDYVEASPLDSELVSLEEENDGYQEEEEFDLE
nr:hypothetical protein [Tanacetum cinerariifolium]